MVALVLAANLLADGVREAFDPRSRSLRPRLGIKPRAMVPAATAPAVAAGKADPGEGA
jgi:peptide/nickel transport system permease protein